jgi:hypothetical protein
MFWPLQRRMAHVALLSLLFLLISGPHLAQPLRERNGAGKGKQDEKAYPCSAELYEAETIRLEAPPLTMVMTGIKCDLSGNVYLVYSDAPPAIVSQRQDNLLSLRKLSPESKAVVTYVVQSLGSYEFVRRSDFAVDPRGSVYMLLEAYHRRPDKEHKEIPDYIIAKFKEDGTLDSFVKLQKTGPENFEPFRFAAFPDGNFLVTGVVMSDRGDFEKAFTGIFNRAGLLVQEVKPSGDVGPQPAPPVPEVGQGKGGEQAGAATEPGQAEAQGRPRKSDDWVLAVGYSLMASAPDGNIYLLRGSNPVRIYAISPIGEVVRQWSVKPPRADVLPSEMSLAGQNRLLLEFTHAATPEDSQIHLILALLDFGTGEVTATYKLPEGRLGIPACMTPRDEFLTLGTTEDRKLKVVKFVAR